MTTFKYEALSASGAKVNGSIEAYDKLDAIAKIRENGETVIKISEQKGMGILSMDIGGGKIKLPALSLLCSQFSIILSSGLPLVRAVELVANQTTDKTLRQLLYSVAGDVSAGHSLADSFEDRGPTLPTTFIETVRAGEKSGNLENSFARLEKYYDKASKTRGKVKSALTYPALILVVAIVVIIIIMVVAVPMFKQTFEDLGGELPLVTRILIGASDFFSQYIIIIIAVVAAVILFYKLYGRTESGKVNLAKFKLKMPVLGKINRLSCASTFANTMTTMMGSGLTVVNALSITGRVINNYVVGRAVQGMVVDIESGRRLGDAMRRVPYFPELLTEMTAVGEETGSIESTLLVIGEYFDNEVATATERALSLLEPMIIVVLAVFVCFVLLAIYLPMFSMYDSVG
ncbi:MAG: type II secretion system F family protein [Clostridia bacterium]|nr:type II secretion system F family protein [Clostridia bacterium]